MDSLEETGEDDINPWEAAKRLCVPDSLRKAEGAPVFQRASSSGSTIFKTASKDQSTSNLFQQAKCINGSSSSFQNDNDDFKCSFQKSSDAERPALFQKASSHSENEVCSTAELFQKASSHSADGKGSSTAGSFQKASSHSAIGEDGSTAGPFPKASSYLANGDGISTTGPFQKANSSSTGKVNEFKASLFQKASSSSTGEVSNCSVGPFQKDDSVSVKNNNGSVVDLQENRTSVCGNGVISAGLNNRNKNSHSVSQLTDEMKDEYASGRMADEPSDLKVDVKEDTKDKPIPAVKKVPVFGVRKPIVPKTVPDKDGKPVTKMVPKFSSSFVKKKTLPSVSTMPKSTSSQSEKKLDVQQANLNFISSKEPDKKEQNDQGDTSEEYSKIVKPSFLSHKKAKSIKETAISTDTQNLPVTKDNSVPDRCSGAKKSEVLETNIEKNREKNMGKKTHPLGTNSDKNVKLGKTNKEKTDSAHSLGTNTEKKLKLDKTMKEKTESVVTNTKKKSDTFKTNKEKIKPIEASAKKTEAVKKNKEKTKLTGANTEKKPKAVKTNKKKTESNVMTTERKPETIKTTVEKVISITTNTEKKPETVEISEEKKAATFETENGILINASPSEEQTDNVASFASEQVEDIRKGLLAESRPCHKDDSTSGHVNSEINVENSISSDSQVVPELSEQGNDAVGNENPKPDTKAVPLEDSSESRKKKKVRNNPVKRKTKSLSSLQNQSSNSMNVDWDNLFKEVISQALSEDVNIQEKHDMQPSKKLKKFNKLKRGLEKKDCDRPTTLENEEDKENMVPVPVKKSRFLRRPFKESQSSNRQTNSKNNVASKNPKDREHQSFDSIDSGMYEENCTVDSPRTMAYKDQLLRITETSYDSWVQCDTCHKWRKLPENFDSSVLPHKWTCDMNQNEDANSCSAPEDVWSTLNVYVYNGYIVGSVVWARVAGMDWWPGMVDIDPDFQIHNWLNGSAKYVTYYNVTFFDEPVTRGWVLVKNILKFRATDTHERFLAVNQKEGVHNKCNLKRAVKLAQSALKMSLKERKKKFSFVSRYRGTFGSIPGKRNVKLVKPQNVEESSDDDNAMEPFKHTERVGSACEDKGHPKESTEDLTLEKCNIVRRDNHKECYKLDEDRQKRDQEDLHLKVNPKDQHSGEVYGKSKMVGNRDKDAIVTEESRRDVDTMDKSNNDFKDTDMTEDSAAISCKTSTEVVMLGQTLRDDVPSETEVKDDVPSETEVKDDVPSETELKDDAPSETELKDDVPSETKLKDDVPSKTELKDDVPSETELNDDITSETELKDDEPSESELKDDVIPETECTGNVKTKNSIKKDMSLVEKANEAEVSITNITCPLQNLKDGVDQKEKEPENTKNIKDRFDSPLHSTEPLFEMTSSDEELCDNINNIIKDLDGSEKEYIEACETLMICKEKKVSSSKENNGKQVGEYCSEKHVSVINSVNTLTQVCGLLPVLDGDINNFQGQEHKSSEADQVGKKKRPHNVESQSVKEEKVKENSSDDVESNSTKEKVKKYADLSDESDTDNPANASIVMHADGVEHPDASSSENQNIEEGTLPSTEEVTNSQDLNRLYNLKVDTLLSSVSQDYENEASEEITLQYDQLKPKY